MNINFTETLFGSVQYFRTFFLLVITKTKYLLSGIGLYFFRIQAYLLLYHLVKGSVMDSRKTLDMDGKVHKF
jgi:hypothetical protein